MAEGPRGRRGRRGGAGGSSSAASTTLTSSEGDRPRSLRTDTVSGDDLRQEARPWRRAGLLFGVVGL